MRGLPQACPWWLCEERSIEDSQNRPAGRFYLFLLIGDALTDAPTTTI